MNLNIIAYCIFILIVVYIIVAVGRICYRNGNIYVLELVQGHEELCTRINKVLLTGYYLVNIGYAAMTLISWKTITSTPLLVELIAVKTATIVSILCVLHYFNLYVLTKYAQKLI
jgi:hypothetical protein